MPLNSLFTTKAELGVDTSFQLNRSPLMINYNINTESQEQQTHTLDIFQGSYRSSRSSYAHYLLPSTAFFEQTESVLDIFGFIKTTGKLQTAPADLYTNTEVLGWLTQLFGFSKNLYEPYFWFQQASVHLGNFTVVSKTQSSSVFFRLLKNKNNSFYLANNLLKASQIMQRSQQRFVSFN